MREEELARDLYLDIYAAKANLVTLTPRFSDLFKKVLLLLNFKVLLLLTMNNLQ